MLKTVDDISKFRNSVIKQFEAIGRENASLCNFLYEASAVDSVFIVGGFLRSVVNHEKPRDLDVIFNMSTEALQNYIEKRCLDYRRNKFGGFKVAFTNIDVDVWTSETNWAFKSKVVNVGDEYILSKVAQGTFFNYDSLVFDLKTEKINVTQYNDCVRNRKLDIIRKSSNYSSKNPGKINNVVRAFRIRNKCGFDFSDSLCRYIYDEFMELGAYDADSMVGYLRDYVSAKQSEKYGAINNEETIRSYVNYVFTNVSKHRANNKHQLELFSSELA
jgi:hypothetical protein